MKKIKFPFLFLILLFSAACSQMKTAVNSISEPKAFEQKTPNTYRPRGIKNSTPEAHIDEANAIIVSTLAGKKFYIGKEELDLSTISEQIDKKLSANPIERERIYLNADVSADYGEVVRLLDVLRRNNVENIGLMVDPAKQTEKSLYILKVKLSPEPKPEEITPLNAKNLVLMMEKEDRLSFARLDEKSGFVPGKEEIKPEEIDGKIDETLKERPDKSIYIKVPRSKNYGAVVKLIDVVAGAGASAIYLELDDLAT
jgi:biopolymer transport protein ExbD